MEPSEFWPQRWCDVDFRVSQLPEKKIAQAHFAAGTNHEIGIGKMACIEMLRDRRFVSGQMLNAAVIDSSFQYGLERVRQLGAGAVMQRKRQNHAGVARCLRTRPLHFFLADIWMRMQACNVLTTDGVFVAGLDFLL